LIRITVWPQYTNVTDRQDRQRSDSIGRTVLRTVAQKLFALCYRTVVLTVLSKTLVYCDQTIGWIRCHFVRRLGLGPGHTVLDGDAVPPRKWAQYPTFWRMSKLVVQGSWLLRLS